MGKPNLILEQQVSHCIVSVTSNFLFCVRH